jgi:serine/threonine protein phosphatase PrpC
LGHRWYVAIAPPALEPEGESQHWVDRMIAEANGRGGLDNITAIVVRTESVDSATGERAVQSAG